VRILPQGLVQKNQNSVVTHGLLSLDAQLSAPDLSRCTRLGRSRELSLASASLCIRTAALEQDACFTAVIWQSLSIQKTVENVFVCQGLGDQRSYSTLGPVSAQAGDRLWTGKPPQRATRLSLPSVFGLEWVPGEKLGN